MSTHWLDERLAVSRGISSDGKSPVLTVDFAKKKKRIYCPSPDEYKITEDVVQKAYDLGANTIAYAPAWCGPTIEGKVHAKTLGIDAIAYAGLFAYLRKNGVTVPNA